MGISERKHHIKVLKRLLKETKGKIELYSENKNIDLRKEKEIVEALGYTISSLKTDEAYQLEYESRDCVEVVRCKNCKHWQLTSSASIHYCIPTHRFCGSNEFCSLGKIKE